MATNRVTVRTKSKRNSSKKRENVYQFSIERMMPKGYTSSERKRLKEFEKKVLNSRSVYFDVPGWRVGSDEKKP